MHHLEPTQLPVLSFCKTPWNLKRPKRAMEHQKALCERDEMWQRSPRLPVLCKSFHLLVMLQLLVPCLSYFLQVCSRFGSAFLLNFCMSYPHLYNVNHSRLLCDVSPPINPATKLQNWHWNVPSFPGCTIVWSSFPECSHMLPASVWPGSVITRRKGFFITFLHT